MGVKYNLLFLSILTILLLSMSAIAQPLCEDSDEGLNAVEVGTTIYENRSEVDYCQSGNRLVEWYCNADGVLSFEYITCLCVNDICEDSNLTRGETGPIYRLYHIAEVNHFYTTSKEEKNNALNSGYIYEGIIGYLSPVQTIGTAALYRLYHIAEVNHFYTINPEERDAAIRINNYSYDGVQGYVYTIRRADMVPIYRLYDAEEVDHLYTTSKEERDNLTANSGYVYEGIVGYVYPCIGEICTEGTTTQPIQPTSGNEFNEVEPNNEFSEANDVMLTLNVGDKIEIFGAILNDVDVFKLMQGASLGDNMIFDAHASNDFNTRAALFNSDGELLYANDDRSYYGGAKDPYITLDLREDYPELYFAIAPSYLGFESPVGVSDESNYNVQVERKILPFSSVQPNPQRALLDFDGGRVQIGLEPVEDIPRWEETWVARTYPDEQAQIKARVIEMMKEDFADYNVEISTTDGILPQAPYTSVFFGGYNPRFLGLADSIDRYNSNIQQEAIAYVDDLELFVSLDPTADEIATAIANIASHELGHLLGLEHTSGEDLMSTANNARALLQRDDSFIRAELSSGVFPIGWQNSPKLLELGVGRKNA